MKEFLSKSLEETKEIAINFAQSITAQEDKATVVGLYGDLGSGKTTFMKYFAESFGVKEEVQSPTFVIERIYEIPKSSKPLAPSFEFLIHIDAYRLDDGEDLLKLGWQEIISDPKNLICIEWPERVSEIMPAHFVLRFEHVEDFGKNEGGEENQRKISLA